MDALARERQQRFERRELLDQHCMAIIGMSHRKDGTTLFYCKNSWPAMPIVTMTEHDLLSNTILLAVNRKALQCAPPSRRP